MTVTLSFSSAHSASESSTVKLNRAPRTLGLHQSERRATVGSEVGIVRPIGRPKRLDLEAEHVRVPVNRARKVGDVSPDMIKPSLHTCMMPLTRDDLRPRCSRLPQCAGMTPEPCRRSTRASRGTRLAGRQTPCCTVDPKKTSS